MSAKPASSAGAALAASGTCMASSTGTSGKVSQLKIGVYSAMAMPVVPMAMISGSRPNRISA